MSPQAPALTPVTRRYLMDFALRAGIFLLIGIIYLAAPEQLDFTAAAGPTLPLILLWAAVFCSMAAQLNPKSRLTRGCLKQYPTGCRLAADYDKDALAQAVKRQNRGAAKVAVLWLAINLFIGLLYHWGSVLRAAELVVLCAFCYLCDLICVLFFCPFQFFLMHNRCCVNCRIFAWGSWMMASPLMTVLHWYAQSLFWMGVVVLICWEVRFFRHPERFWYGSNLALRCGACTDRLCRYKKLAPKHPI